MQASKGFNEAIKAHLDGLAKNDPLFAETLKKPNKNLTDCTTYIINQVKKSGQTGFADPEVFAMAVHYYDEDDIEVGEAKGNIKVVVNHVVELSAEDKATAHKAAMDKAIAQEQQRLAKKPLKKAEPIEQPSLF